MKARMVVIAIGLVGCAKQPVPHVVVAKSVAPVVINRTIVQTQSALPEGVKPGSKTAGAVKEFRAQEKAARDARGYPGATAQELQDINRTEKAAHGATQSLIDKDGHSTQQDQDDAHDAIDALRKAQQAPSHPDRE